MQTNTETTVRVLIGTMDSAKRAKLLQELVADTPEGRSQEAKERIVRRAEAAKILGRSIRAVDLLREQGHLKLVTMPGRERGAGFKFSDVLSLVNGRAS